MRIRIQGAKPMRIHGDLDAVQTLKSQKVEFLHEKYTLWMQVKKHYKVKKSFWMASNQLIC